MKTVSGMASADQVNLLLIESSMLKDLTHRNLLPVMAVCLEDEKQPLIMFPFMNRGNLKLFIKKSRSPEGGSKVRQKGALHSQDTSIHGLRRDCVSCPEK